MNEDWADAIAFVLKMEGDLTDDPSDPGGLTKYGISKKSYPNLDIASLTLDQAQEIYRRDYWVPCCCDQLPRPYAIGVFDMAVNQGIGKAKRILQIALEVEVDGTIGEKTVAAAHKAPPWRVKKFLAERLAAYARLMVEKPNLLTYAYNWSFRVVSLMELLIVQRPTL